QPISQCAPGGTAANDDDVIIPLDRSRMHERRVDPLETRTWRNEKRHLLRKVPPPPARKRKPLGQYCKVLKVFAFAACPACLGAYPRFCFLLTRQDRTALSAWEPPSVERAFEVFVRPAHDCFPLLLITGQVLVLRKLNPRHGLIFRCPARDLLLNGI